MKHSTIPGIRWLVSAIPENDNFIEKNLQPEAPDKIIAIIKERLLSERKDFVTVGSNKKNFLPSSFLQTGAQNSLTVCRIARYFSLDVFQSFIEEFEKIADDNSFNSREKLQEIFSIPNQVADEIFQGEEQPLVKLKHLKENQLSKLNPIPIGTGFLVGGTHLLTNHHVIPDKKVAEQCVAQFNYVEDSQGYTENSIDYEFEPEILFVCEPNLDYTLIQLKAGMFTRQAGYSFDWLQLIEDEEIIIPKLSDDEKKELYLRQGISSENFLGDEVFIIQHPKGRQKKIDQNENRVLENGLYTNFLRYQSDSDYGSSGSPVFNTKWELVALHHAVITKASNSESDSKPYEQKSSVNVIANQGVRICRIVEDLKKKSFSNPKLKSFVQDFVLTAEQLNYPPFPAALDFDGKQSYVSLDGTTIVAFFDYQVSKSFQGYETNISFFNQSGVKLGNLKVSSFVQEIAFSPDGETVALACGEIKLYNLKGQEVLSFQGHTNQGRAKSVNSISFSPDGKLIASVSDDKTVKLWNLNGQEIQTFQGHTESVNSISFSPDGKLIASASDDKTVKLWNLNGQEIQTFQGHKYAVYKVSFSSDGTTIASANYSRLLFGMHGIDTEYVPNEITVLIWKLDGVVLTNIVDIGFLASFNPKASYCLTTDNSSILNNPQSFTIEAWVNPYRSSSLAEAIISSSKPGGFSLGLTASGQLFLDLSGNFSYDDVCIPPLYEFNLVAASKSKNTDTTYFSDEKVISFNQFSHIAFTYDLTEIKFYINGKEVYRKNVNASLDFPYSILIGTALRGKKDKSDIKLLNGFFLGAIGEVRLWKVALNQDQINRNIYRRLTDLEAELIGYWRFEESISSNKVYNLASADEYGLVCQTNCLSASQAYSLALPCGLKFSGESGQYVDCGKASLDVTDAITVEAWVKHKFGNCLIVSRGGNGKHGYSLSWHDGKIRVVLQGENPPATVVDTKENAPQDQVWHHVAFTWDQHSQEISIYIDGRRQDSVVIEGQCKTIAYAGQTQSFGLFAGSIAHLTANLMIGCKEEEEKYYNVAIAEVRIWKASRPQDKIKANMSRRLKGNEKELVGYWRLDDGGEGNNQARNLVSGNKGTIYGAKWFPVHEIINTGNKEEEDSTDIS